MEEYTIKLTRSQAEAVMALFVEVCLHRERLDLTDEEFEEITSVDLEDLVCMEA